MFIAALFTIAKLWNQPCAHQKMNDIQYVLLFSHKEEQNYIACRNMDRTGDHHIKQNKPVLARELSQVFCQCEKILKAMKVKGGLLRI
jgi:hypothetical protein